MKVDYVLVATGNVTLPRVDHIVNGSYNERAIEMSKDVAATLSKAGYFNFTLYSVIDDRQHIQLVTLRVEQPEPIVSVK